MEEPILDTTIKYYFHMGLQQYEILLFLLQHGINISSATLKRHLKRLNLCRRKNYSPLEKIIDFLDKQIITSASLHGYRWNHRKCLHAGLNVKQETVRHFLNIVDPAGVSSRRRRKLQRRQYSSKGSNYLWHVDGYDKLKPYGFAISGCIDGFSRKILWLKTSYTNNDPKVIAGYFIETVRTLNGHPRTVRTDMGTENVYIENMQIYFYELNQNNYRDSELPPFLYGSSHTNQRIEAWWSILRKHHSQFWMNLFSQLKDDGRFTGSIVDKSILQYCFMDIIQEELNSMKLEWNTHAIRMCRYGISPAGRPEVLFNFPETHGCINYLTTVETRDIENCEEECSFLDCPCADKDVYDLCEILLVEMDLSKSKDAFDAVNLYINLRNEILTLL